MKHVRLWMFAAILSLCGLTITSCSNDDDETNTPSWTNKTLHCTLPTYLVKGDKIALISPSYFTPMENVEKTSEVLRRWGFEPVVGPNVGKIDAGKYAGTVEERLSDIRWALNDPRIKAIICNRGGYGAIQLINQLQINEFSKNPKWLVGFSDVTTLHEMESCAGVMSIHGTMSSFLAAGGRDTTSTLMRDLLMGFVPRYEVPTHPYNRIGKAQGTLVGGNLMTFAPVVGSAVDATSFNDIILFIEEVGESMHNIDRQVNMLMMTGALSRCRGVILGDFLSCPQDLGYESVEAMLSQYFSRYNIPVLCGLPAGHDDVNLPLVMGAPVTLDVRADGGTLTFDIAGQQREIRTAGVMAKSTSLVQRMRKAGKRE